MTDTIETRRSNLDGRRVRVTQRQWTENGIQDLTIEGVIESEVWHTLHRCHYAYMVRTETDIPFMREYSFLAHDEEITLL